MRYVSIPLALTALVLREVGDYITSTIEPSPPNEFGLHEIGFSLHVYSVIVLGILILGVARIFRQYFLRLHQTKSVIDALGGQEAVDVGLEKKAHQWLNASHCDDTAAMDRTMKSFHTIVDWLRKLDYRVAKFDSYVEKTITA